MAENTPLFPGYELNGLSAQDLGNNLVDVARMACFKRDLENEVRYREIVLQKTIEKEQACRRDLERLEQAYDEAAAAHKQRIKEFIMEACTPEVLAKHPDYAEFVSKLSDTELEYIFKTALSYYQTPAGSSAGQMSSNPPHAPAETAAVESAPAVP